VYSAQIGESEIQNKKTQLTVREFGGIGGGLLEKRCFAL